MTCPWGQKLSRDRFYLVWTIPTFFALVGFTVTGAAIIVATIVAVLTIVVPAFVNNRGRYGHSWKSFVLGREKWLYIGAGTMTALLFWRMAVEYDGGRGSGLQNELWWVLTSAAIGVGFWHAATKFFSCQNVPSDREPVFYYLSAMFGVVGGAYLMALVPLLSLPL